MELTVVDWLIVAAFVAVTIGIGVGFSRRASESIAEYFVSGRSLPWWIAGTSMVATTFAADTPLAVTGIIIKRGLAGNWIWWAFAVGGMITVFVYARLWRRSEMMTDVELIEFRYSGRPAAFLRGFRALYIAVLVNSIIIGWVCGAMMTFFEETLFPASEYRDQLYWLLLVGSLTLIALYCTLSGLWGVAMTDAVQFVLAMTGCILLAVVAMRHVGGGTKLRAAVTEQFGTADVFAFLPTISGDDPLMPASSLLIILLVQWWATWYPGAEPGGGGYVVQRMAACRNESHAVGATLWFQIAHYCLRPWPWIIVAFAAVVMFPELRENYLADPSYKPDRGYPMVIREIAPAGLRGLMLVTFFAAFMSTISTQMNWGASYLVRDVYQRFIAPDESDKHYTRVSRIASLGVLATGGVAAYLMRHMSVDAIWQVLLALGAGTGGVFMLRWFWWRINAWTEIASMIGSLVLFLLIAVEEKTWPTHVIAVDTPEQKVLVVALVSMVFWLLTTFVTKPTERQILTRVLSQGAPGRTRLGTNRRGSSRRATRPGSGLQHSGRIVRGRGRVSHAPRRGITDLRRLDSGGCLPDRRRHLRWSRGLVRTPRKNGRVGVGVGGLVGLRRLGQERAVHHPCLPVSQSPCLLVSLSPCLLVSLSPRLPVSPSPVSLPQIPS